MHYSCLRIFSFLVVGLIGFSIEAIVISSFVNILDTNSYLPRVFSFPTALFVTWLLNRNFGFKVNQAINFAEFFRYVVANGFAQGTNLLCYSGLLYFDILNHELLSLFFATSLSTFISFLLYKDFVFKKFDN